MKKTILVINGHPNPTSYCQALANSYVLGAKEGEYSVELVNLHELHFNQNYIGQRELEEDLKVMQQKLVDCQHLVIITPMWWLGVTSMLKGFFDRVLTPGFAYRFKKHGIDRLLKGRSGRVIYTMGGNKWMYDWLFLDCFWIGLKYGVLWLCGFSPVKRTAFSKVPYVSQNTREEWLEKVRILGLNGK